MNTKIFYDGVNIKDFYELPYVVGFTTNLSFMAQADISDFTDFAKNYLTLADNRPVSFQCWGETEDEIIDQCKTISSWGNNVYAKIPIVQSNGSSNIAIIKKLHNEGYKINVTVVHTIKQIDSISNIFNNKTPVVVSVFAGGISDAGAYPEPIVKHSVDTFKHLNNVETLWAGCQRILSVIDAKNIGCEIITVPDAVLKKYDRLGKDLHAVSISKSKTFRDDALKSNLHF